MEKPPSSIGTMRFLVVEDQGFQRWAVGHLLESMGAAHVLSAADGNAALDLLRTCEQPIDVVISDLDMPGMDGMALIRHLGEARQPFSLILASGLERSLVASVEGMAAAYGVNVIASIGKPITAAKLAAALARYAPAAIVPETRPEHEYTLDEIAAGLANGHFVAYFQPKVGLHDNLFRGAEAVARWRHPARGLIPPRQFVRTLESSMRIDDLTMLMLRQAALVCRQWKSSGIDATISVNVSLVSLNDLDLAERMTEIVLREGIMPRDVILEVTETAAASHLGKVLENLSRLRMKGFGLAIDDFGTGYASMEQLTRIPFSELKIDQGFVTRAATHRASHAVLESSLEMAHKLGIAAVAEGIETREQLIMLRELGCDLGQGYYIGAPMPAEELWKWIAQYGKGDGVSRSG